MLDTGSALQFFHGRVHWPGSGVSSTLCGRCPEHLRTFDAGSILERENGVSQNNTHHNDNTKALIKILSSVLSTAATKQGGEHNQKQFRIRIMIVTFKKLFKYYLRPQIFGYSKNHIHVRSCLLSRHSLCKSLMDLILK